MKVKSPPTPKVFDRTGSTEDLLDYIQLNNPGKKVLIITSADLVKIGLVKPLVSGLKRRSISYELFDDVEPNPSFATVEHASTFYKVKNCEAILAFGGGSVIDAAKSSALQIGNNVRIKELLGIFQAKKDSIPTYIIPTTAGTGSEVTSSAVLSNPDSHQKEFITDHKIIPLAVALDANTMLTLPNFITADTGMDVLTHAIEAYLTKIHNSAMMDSAVNAVQLVFKNLPKAYQNGSDVIARKNMSIASFKAGMAFNHMGLGFVHAISHQLTAFYGVPHGRANAIVLPRVLKTSLPKIAPQLAELAMKAGIAPLHQEDLKIAQIFINKIEELSRTVNIPIGIGDIERPDFDAIARNAIAEARSTYPVRAMLSHKQCRDVLENIKQTSPSNAKNTATKEMAIA